MVQQEQVVTMSDKAALFVKLYMPSGEVIGHVHILHGMAEHSRRYADFAQMLVQEGYIVSMHDHRGHGQTVEYGGTLGFFAEYNGFERVVQDVHEVLQAIRHETWPQTVLFGHSMGSFIARRYAQLHSRSIKALILSGTGTYLPTHAIAHQLATVLANVTGKEQQNERMTKLSVGTFNQSIVQPQTAFDWLSYDADAVQQYIEDPKCGFTLTNQFFVDLTAGIKIISQDDEVARIRPTLPILLISGMEDAVGGYGKGVHKVARQLHKVGLANVCVYLFEQMRHEILNEKNKQQVYKVIKRWLKYEK